MSKHQKTTRFFVYAAAFSVCSAFAALTPFADGERVTFLGDSITHGGAYHGNLQLFWDLRHPGSGTRLMNCGLSGGRSEGGLARWTWDALPQKAGRTFVMFGMNDVGRDAIYETQTPDAATEEKRAKRRAVYEKNMAGIADAVRAAGQRLVVVTPTPFDQYSPTNVVKCANTVACNDPGLSSYAESCRRLAAERGAELVDLHRPLTEILKNGTPLCPADRVHPQPPGHLVMMAEFLVQMGETNALSETVRDAAGADRLAFAYAPARLPFPVTDDYRKADRCYPLTERINREMLTVKNLAPGLYALKADGRALGAFTAEALAAGVNLALLETPAALKAREAWTVSRKIVQAQAQVRSLVLLETIAKKPLAKTPEEIAEVDRAMVAYVENCKARKYPWAQYYVNQLAAYRRDKPRQAKILAEEEAARRRLAAIGAEKPPTCTLSLERVDKHAAIRAQIEALQARPARATLPPYLEGDFDEACGRAKAEGKNVLVSFGREICGRCQVFYERVKRGDVAIDPAKWTFIRLDADNSEHREYFLAAFEPDTPDLPYVGVMDGERQALKPCLTGSQTAAAYEALMK